MFEFEEMSSGFHDGFLNKYADTSGPIYDIYISDSMQDMLDIDIRTEVATVVGGSNEFSSIINDIPSYDDTDPICKDGDAWLGGPKWSATNDYYGDVGACVNPNSVMPIISSSLLHSPKDSLNSNNLRRTMSPSCSPRANKSHLTFSPNQIKMPSILQEKRLSTQLATPVSQNNRNAAVDSIKKDLRNQLLKATENEQKFEKNNGILQSKGLMSGTTNTIKLAPGIGGLTFANSVTYNKLKQQSSMSKPMSTLSQNGNLILKRDRDSSPLQNMATLNNGHYNGNHQTSKILPRTIASQKKTVSINNSNQITNHSSHKVNQNNNNKNKIPISPEFPKPAYSYSCLIAMSLKNSRGGSLPVSEIYSFMCEHFPYFKTAPNGWKNSVRHNLSLNKCFEKIEKPATNGQRKGCLWAMNPTKIAKMDEEVQKWSRKDPMAIRKAMVYPEHLEALERGEMKHGSLCDSELELDGPSDVEGSSDSEPEQEIDDIVNETTESYVEEDDEDQHSQGRDFDIEVQDIYDAIDLEDDKDNGNRSLQHKGIMDTSGDGYSSPKRARLNINYSITPAGSYEHYQQSNKMQQRNIVNHHHHQQQQQHHHHHHHTNIQHQNRRKVQLVNRIA